MWKKTISADSSDSANKGKQSDSLNSALPQKQFFSLSRRATKSEKKVSTSNASETEESNSHKPPKPVRRTFSFANLSTSLSRKGSKSTLRNEDSVDFETQVVNTDKELAEMVSVSENSEIEQPSIKYPESGTEDKSYSISAITDVAQHTIISNNSLNDSTLEANMVSKPLPTVPLKSKRDVSVNTSPQISFLQPPATPPITERPSSIFANPTFGTAFPRSDGKPINDYLQLILTAKVYDIAIESPMTPALNLSSRIKNNVFLKREDLQPVFSFKLRGASHRMQQLTKEEQLKGVIACSAGNHAQGVALAAQKMGISATIVMPLATPPIKWKNVKRLGADVVLFGNDFDEAKDECARLIDEGGLTNIHPFDDPYVISGQGTIAVEIMKQIGDTKIDAIFVCVGGGGLIAGIASYIKRIYPEIKIIGVETYDANAMTLSLVNKARVTLSEVGLFADGAAVRSVGEETFRICQENVDEMILVSTDEICAAIKDTFEDTRSVIEPAGALGVAGIKKYCLEKRLVGKNFVAVTSGANMNFDRLRFVAERAFLGENTEALVTVIIPEKPGSFMQLNEVVYPRAVTSFSYRYSDKNEAHVIMSFRVQDRQPELAEIFKKLNDFGFRANDVSHSEMAKAHAVHLVGGRGQVENERIFRFSFPERPGALQHFLKSLKPIWNISLFHYRNYGGDIGKVMVGIQVPEETSTEFEDFLNNLKYPYVEETGNPVYQQFLL
ncbi:hypothetical protein HK096_001206 [Nowakowskiella sp. JEL0078]|nr:hypothetical protein HK096_001206 [Nowakowskiella sp. JEL0078]